MKDTHQCNTYELLHGACVKATLPLSQQCLLPQLWVRNSCLSQAACSLGDDLIPSPNAWGAQVNNDSTWSGHTEWQFTWGTSTVPVMWK